MDIINAILKFIVTILDKLLPALGVSDNFYNIADSAFSSFVGILKTASFFVPLDVLVLCMTTMLIVDNFAIMSRL